LSDSIFDVIEEGCHLISPVLGLWFSALRKSK
jgi:hypothetical protein